MPMPPEPVEDDGLPPLWDPGNTLLTTGQPSMIMSGKVPAADGGEVGIITIRTPDCSLTVSLDKAAAQDWAGVLAELAAMLPAPSKLIIPSRHVTPAVAVMPPNGTQRR